MNVIISIFTYLILTSLEIKNIYVDCDRDSILFTVIPAGPACHTMRISCFHNDLDQISDEKPLIETGVMDKVFNIIEERKKDMGMENSYTSSLFKEGFLLFPSSWYQRAKAAPRFFG